jgi:TrmH family RNA methyltransferase
MISKSKIKFITSLQTKKFRDEQRLFVIEGDKLVREFLATGISAKMLVAKPEFINGLPPEHTRFVDSIETASYN